MANILSRYNRAIPSEVRDMCVGASHKHFVIWSTKTAIALYPPASGNSPIKSVPITSQGSDGTLCGTRGPVGFCWWILVA